MSQSYTESNFSQNWSQGHSQAKQHYTVDAGVWTPGIDISIFHRMGKFAKEWTKK